MWVYCAICCSLVSEFGCVGYIFCFVGLFRLSLVVVFDCLWFVSLVVLCVGDVILGLILIVWIFAVLIKFVVSV